MQQCFLIIPNHCNFLHLKTCCDDGGSRASTKKGKTTCIVMAKKLVTGMLWTQINIHWQSFQRELTSELLALFQHNSAFLVASRETPAT